MNENVRAVNFPYCLEQQDDGSWVLLNRNYEPVGFNTDDFIRYEEHPVSIRLRGLGPATLKRLAFDGEINGDGAKSYVMLYNVKDKSCERSEPRLVLVVGRARQGVAGPL